MPKKVAERAHGKIQLIFGFNCFASTSAHPWVNAVLRHFTVSTIQF